MSESLNLKPGQYDKLGNIHCGVMRDRLVSCAGDLKELADGEAYLFSRAGVNVTRNGDEFTFNK